MGRVRSGDWLSLHDEEGQTFREYLDTEPVIVDEQRNVIYIQPLGEFSAKQQEILDLTAEFLALFFSVEVKVREGLPLSVVPASARRTHPQWGMKQILTSYVLDEILAPALPDDAVTMIALTSSDLWPGKGWNFVFGQAYLYKRVGVWSIYRNGVPEAGREEYRVCLLRTIATAAHEVAHMFSISHCIAYECVMCGSNSREESDRRPLALCPECLAKVCWATHVGPVKRYRKLAAFCRKHGLEFEAKFYEESIRALQDEIGEKGGR